MSFLKNKIIKAMGIIICFIMVFFLLFTIIRKYYPNEFGKVFKSLGLFQVDPFKTSEEYRQRLGVEIISAPLFYEENLHLMIKNVYKKGLDYFNTGDNRNFKETESYFLPEEYERIKQGIEKSRQECQKQKEQYKNDSLHWCEEGADFSLSEIKFSQPRKYRDLPERIGVMAIVPVIYSNYIDVIIGGGGTSSQYHIFIFKQINNEWKIEKIQALGGGVPPAEIGEESAVIKVFEKIKKEIKK